MTSQITPTLESTSEQRCKAHQANIQALLVQLQEKLGAYSDRVNAQPSNWGHAGKLGYIEIKLQELVDGL